jgi:xanthine dehydrogenase YagS FAD-binding subunit
MRCKGMHDPGRLDDAEIAALRGVAPKPWRSVEAASFLAGTAPTIEAFRNAAEIALSGASPFEHNGFKVDLAKHAIVRALTLAAN